MPTYKDLVLDTSTQKAVSLRIKDAVLQQSVIIKTPDMFKILSLLPLLNSPESSKTNDKLNSPISRPKQITKLNSRIEVKKTIINQGRTVYKLTDPQIAYILATVKKECDFVPVHYAYYDQRLFNEAKKRFGNYYGRGFVQLTWENNYRKMQERLKKEGVHVDLVGNPDLALDPEIAMKILFIGMIEGSFTGLKLKDFINENKTDFYNARKIINALDYAQQIALFAKSFFEELTLNKPSNLV